MTIDFSFLEKKYGPFSAWEWVALGSGGVLVYGLLKKKPAAAASTTTGAVQPVSSDTGSGLPFDANTATLVSYFDNESALLQQIVTNQNKAAQAPVTPVTNPQPTPTDPGNGGNGGGTLDPTQTYGSLSLIFHQRVMAGAAGLIAAFQGGGLASPAATRSSPSFTGASTDQIATWMQDFQNMAAGNQPVNNQELQDANNWMASQNNLQDRSGLFTWPNFAPNVFSFVPGLPGWLGGQDTETQGGGGTSPTPNPPNVQVNHPLDIAPSANEPNVPIASGTDLGTVPIHTVVPPNEDVPSWLHPLPVVGSPLSTAMQQRSFAA